MNVQIILKNDNLLASEAIWQYEGIHTYWYVASDMQIAFIHTDDYWLAEKKYNISQRNQSPNPTR